MSDKSLGQISPLLQRLRNAGRRGDNDADEAANEIDSLNHLRRLLQSENEELKVRLTRSGIELLRAVFAERERICAAIKDADDLSRAHDYMLDSDDCIDVAHGLWQKSKES